MDPKETTRPALTDEQALAILKIEKARAKRIAKAYRPFTPYLFGFWCSIVSLLLVVSIWLSVASISESPPPWDDKFWSLEVMIFMVLITGTFVAREIEKVHKRIDAMLTLIEEMRKTSNK